MPDNKEKVCIWKLADYGMYGCHDYEWNTTCGKSYDCDKLNHIEIKYCPNCGGKREIQKSDTISIIRSKNLS